MVCYEFIGKGKSSELLARGIDAVHLLHHFRLRNEYIFQKCASPLDKSSSLSEPKLTQVMTVLDVDGISFSDFSADVIQYVFLNLLTLEVIFDIC